MHAPNLTTGKRCRQKVRRMALLQSPVDRTGPTFATLGRFLETDKAKLKKSGADRQAQGTSHDTLKLACAWRLENPVEWGKYMSNVQQLATDMERIRQAGVKPAGGAPPMLP